MSETALLEETQNTDGHPVLLTLKYSVMAITLDKEAFKLGRDTTMSKIIHFGALILSKILTEKTVTVQYDPLINPPLNSPGFLAIELLRITECLTTGSSVAASAAPCLLLVWAFNRHTSMMPVISNIKRSVPDFHIAPEQLSGIPTAFALYMRRAYVPSPDLIIVTV